MAFYIEYCLGWRSQSNKKADKGTIVHKVMEICGLAKKHLQEGKLTFEDDIIGTVLTDKYEENYLNEIIEKVYTYYTSNIPHHEWSTSDFNECKKWVWKALQQYDGDFDPRYRDIVDVEVHFDIEIKEDWAKYEYDGVSGYLGLKGTIDLVTNLGDGCYEVVDWKTGKRLDWATGEEKTQEKLFSDPQLRIYHYALSRVYPEMKSLINTIYFINDGGPYSLHFHEHDLAKTEEMLQKKFEFIKRTEIPKQNKSWKCTKFCYYGRSSFENTSITPLIQKNYGDITAPGQIMTKCEQTKHALDIHGCDHTTKTMLCPGHNVMHYKAPGEVS
jgi:hypothetical protein